jgi:hypothetical protein
LPETRITMDSHLNGFAYSSFSFQPFSGIFLLVKGWTKTSYLLIPLTFSILSVLVGIIQINRFAFVWNGYCHLVGGFVFAILATLCFLSVVIIKLVCSYHKDYLKRLKLKVHKAYPLVITRSARGIKP